MIVPFGTGVSVRAVRPASFLLTIGPIGEEMFEGTILCAVDIGLGIGEEKDLNASAPGAFLLFEVGLGGMKVCSVRPKAKPTGAIPTVLRAQSW